MKKGASSPVAFDDEKYRAESDCRTLTDAEEIRADSRRFGGARRHARTYSKRLKRATARPARGGKY